MAKAKLTKEAIKYIATLYNSETEVHTFSEIKDKIKAKYGIEVTLQTVQQNYHKYMEELKKVNKTDNSVSVTNTDTNKKSMNTSKPSSSTFTFSAKAQKTPTKGIQYQDADDLGVTSNEIQDLLKVDK